MSYDRLNKLNQLKGKIELMQNELQSIVQSNKEEFISRFLDTEDMRNSDLLSGGMIELIQEQIEMEQEEVFHSNVSLNKEITEDINSVL